MDFWFICSSLESYLAAPSSLGKVHIRSRFELEQSCPCKPKPLDSTNKQTRKQTFDHTSKSDQASWYDARSIEIIPRGRPPFLGWLCGYMLMNSRDRTPSSWWNLKADPLWLMNSRYGPIFGGCMLMNSKGRPPFGGCMLMNSRRRPPFGGLYVDEF